MFSKTQKGYTLIELVIVIAIVAVVVAGTLGALNQVLFYQPNQLKQMSALNLAISRMELLLALARNQGFDAVSVANDPCQNGSSCTRTGYGVSLSVTTGWTGSPSDTDTKTITVIVNGLGQATLQTLITR